MIVFVLGNLVLTSILAALITVRKVRRDRRELWSRAHRDELRDALHGGGDALDRLVRDVRDHADRGIELAGVLHEAAADGDDWALHAARIMAERVGLDEVLHGRLRHRRPVVRGTAALLLGHLRSGDAVLRLRPLLADPDGDVRLVAAGALARIGSGSAADALIGGLVARTLPPERLIERLGAPWAAPMVLARLQASDDLELVSGLARALGLAGYAPAEPDLIALLGHTEIELRISAARALATCGARASVGPLVDALQGDAWEVRAQAATSLGAIGAVEAVPALEAALGNHAWWVRSNAATSLAQLGPAGEAALRRALAGPDAYASERAAEALASVAALQRSAA